MNKESCKKQIADLCPNWRSTLITLGAHAGKTVEYVYVKNSNDLYDMVRSVDYCSQVPETEVNAVRAAILYKEMVDPFADSSCLMDLG
jgi:hypothetical protein